MTVVLGLLVGARQDLVRGLNGLELGVNLSLLAGIAVGVIFERLKREKN